MINHNLIKTLLKLNHIDYTYAEYDKFISDNEIWLSSSYRLSVDDDILLAKFRRVQKLLTDNFTK